MSYFKDLKVMEGRFGYQKELDYVFLYILLENIDGTWNRCLDL